MYIHTSRGTPDVGCIMGPTGRGAAGSLAGVGTTLQREQY